MYTTDFLCVCNQEGTPVCDMFEHATHTHARVLLCVFFLPVWLTTQNHSTLVTERSAVPFLPVNPEYSATRNQVRPHEDA